MTNYRFAFYASSKPRTVHLGRWLAEGAKVHGDTVEIIPQDDAGVLDDFDGGAILGMAQTSKRLLNAYLRAGKHFLVFDKGYMDRKRHWRVSVDAWQPLAYFQRFKRPSDRLEKLMAIRNGFQINPRQVRADGDVLIAGTCQAHNNYHDLGDVTEYHTELVRQLRKYTARTIVYRPNPSWVIRHTEEFKPIPNTRFSSPDADFRSELDRAHLLITHGSSAAFSALALGVPVMVLGDGIAKPMALGAGEWDRVEDPYWPTDKERRQFFCDAAYCQWDQEEYRSGQAWEQLRLTLLSLAKEPERASMFDVITQYREMHKNPKYFRGIGTVKYFRNIGELVLKHGSKTLLDYGSGKGLQYDTPHELQKAWGVQVTCYDPGVEAFAKLPDGIFDGVICCDVMEHIPEPLVDQVLGEAISRAKHFAFFAIATSPAKKLLPDGRNCHLTVRSEDWWQEKIAAARKTVKAKNVETMLIALADDYSLLPPVTEDEEFDDEDGDEEA